MAANYVLLERITVGAAGAASVTFNNIPQTGYTDLKLVYSARTDEATTAAIGYIKFNGSSSDFTNKSLQGTGSAVSSFSIARFAAYAPGTSNTANVFSNGEIYIPNYNVAQAHSFSGDATVENNATTGYCDMFANLWAPATAQAITTIDLATTASKWLQYSTFSLYGLAAVGTTPAIAPYAVGGDIVQTDGTYWYHAFLSSGTFTPTKALSCDTLVVAGGGGGTQDNGAGGSGAGGLVIQSARSVPIASYTVTVGAGGSGGTGAPGQGTKGNNSVFDTITALGGGQGEARNIGAGPTTGGSGGGGAYYGSAAGATGNQPNSGGGTGYASAGGNGGSGGNGGAGGGGGAGGAGVAGNASYGGAGGVGFYNSLTDAMGAATGTGQLSSTHYYYAGGGGGGMIQGNGSNQGAGGLGGGGQGGTYQGTIVQPTAGAANTGGGAGGNGVISGTSVSGGSGIVIIRYAV